MQLSFYSIVLFRSTNSLTWYTETTLTTRDFHESNSANQTAKLEQIAKLKLQTITSAKSKMQVNINCRYCIKMDTSITKLKILNMNVILWNPKLCTKLSEYLISKGSRSRKQKFTINHIFY